jgi:hypothetical protein
MVSPKPPSVRMTRAIHGSLRPFDGRWPIGAGAPELAQRGWSLKWRVERPSAIYQTSLQIIRRARSAGFPQDGWR